MRINRELACKMPPIVRLWSGVGWNAVLSRNCERQVFVKAG
jgi:hypothetical protein